MKLVELNRLKYPVVAFQVSDGGSGVYPELILITWDGKESYKVIWDAAAGDHGGWEIIGNTLKSSQDNWAYGSHADTKTRFIQEYQFDGETFKLVNQYSEETKGQSW